MTLNRTNPRIRWIAVRVGLYPRIPEHKDQLNTFLVDRDRLVELELRKLNNNVHIHISIVGMVDMKSVTMTEVSSQFVRSRVEIL